MEINVNNITLYYEKEGHGDPLIFLHGNQESLEIFDVLKEKMKQHFTVYLIDSRNHGRSSFSSIFSYEQMASDIYQFMTALELKNTYVIGFSDGGIIAKIIEIRHPNTFKKMVCLGSNTRPKGIKRDVLYQMKQMFRNTKNRYIEMMIKEPNIKKKELRQIKIPVLLIRGSLDVILYHHSKMISRQIKSSKLIELKHQTHDDYIIHNDMLYPILLNFYTEL